jgi:YbbR domain-containing protein
VIVDANGLPNPTLPEVNVTLRTDRNQRTELRPVDIRTVVDLSGLQAGEHIVPVNVQATRSTISFSVPADGVSPSALPIRLEQVVTATVPIDLKVIGNLPFSFERGAPQISYSGGLIQRVTIVGPQNRVQRVVGAQTTANIEQLRASYQAPLALVAVDASGQLVDGVRVDPSTVTVRIPITSVVGLKLVPVAADIVGLPAAGYEVSSVRVDPPLISLTGSSGPLDTVAVLHSEPMDISGVTSSIVRRVRLIFPAGTSPQSGEPMSVQITVLVSPIARIFQVALPAQVTIVGAGGGLLVSVNPDVVSVSIAGTSAFLGQLGQQVLRADVNVAGLGPGSYQLPVQVGLPNGVSLAGDPPVVTVTVRSPPAPPTESPTPTSSATPTSGILPTPGPSESPAAATPTSGILPTPGPSESPAAATPTDTAPTPSPAESPIATARP